MAANNENDKNAGQKNAGHTPLDARAAPEPALPLQIAREGAPMGAPPASPALAPASPALAPIAMRKAWRYGRFIPLAMGFVFLGGMIGLYFQPPGLRIAMRALGLKPGGGTNHPIAIPAPAPAAVVAPVPLVVGLAKLSPEDELRTIAAPYGAGDARLAQLRVKEGERVAAGAVLAVFDNEGALKAALAAAQAALSSRQAGLEQARANVSASRQEAQAALARAQTSADAAQREFERAEQLHKSGIASEQNLDQKRAARDEAARETERLRASLSRFASQTLDAQPDIVVAARALDAAQADLARAEADLEKAYARAPADGYVLTIFARPGEKPGVQGLMSFGDVSRMKADIEIYQTQIGRVAIGDAVELRAEALPHPLHAIVTRIGLEVQKQTLIDPSPAANTDARVVKVWAKLDEASQPIAARYSNLQVIARIRVGDKQ